MCIRDSLSGDSEKVFLNAAETGSALNFSFTAQNGEKTEGTYLSELYNSDYKDWLSTAAEQYKRLSEIFAATGGTALEMCIRDRYMSIRNFLLRAKSRP